MIKAFFPERRPKDLSFGRRSGKKLFLPFSPGNQLPGYYRDVPPGQQGILPPVGFIPWCIVIREKGDGAHATIDKNNT